MTLIWSLSGSSFNLFKSLNKTLYIVVLILKSIILFAAFCHEAHWRMSMYCFSGHIDKSNHWMLKLVRSTLAPKMIYCKPYIYGILGFFSLNKSLVIWKKHKMFTCVPWQVPHRVKLKTPINTGTSFLVFLSVTDLHNGPPLSPKQAGPPSTS